MKVSELLENWDNAQPDPKTYIRLLRKKLNAVEHQRELLSDRTERKSAEHENLPDDQRINSELYYKVFRPIDERGKQLTLLADKIRAELAKAKTHMKYIIHDPELAFRHAKSVRNGEFPEGEDAMATDAKIAYDYAVNVLGKRFYKGEPAIAKVSELRNGYRQRFGTINYEYPPNESK